MHAPWPPLRDATTSILSRADLDTLFLRLRAAAVGFDRQRRAGLRDDDVATFTRILDRLYDNVAVATEAP